MSWLSRLANVFRTTRVERDLDDELRFHIEARIDQRVAEGLTHEAAEQEVTRQFGGQLRLREQSRDVKLLPWLDSLVKDVRFGARMLRKDAVVTGAAVISLALAIGACTAAFSLIDALILRPLPVRAPEQLFYLSFQSEEPGQPEGDIFQYELFERFRTAANSRAELFAVVGDPETRPMVFPDGSGAPERVRPQAVSGEAFATLGVRPEIGRVLGPSDARHPVAVLSHAFWMRGFGGDPSLVGRSFTHDNHAFEIVGVAAKGFTGLEPGRSIDLWVPSVIWNEAIQVEANRFRILGRLEEGVQAKQVQNILQATFTNYRREEASVSFQPDWSGDSVEPFVNVPLYMRSAENGASALRRQFQRPLLILAIVVSLVLLIAASNVANLFLARAAAREREMSLRLSIGAARGRLIQQVLIEGALLAIVACALGMLFAAAAGPFIVRMLAPADNPAYLDLGVDWRVLAFLGVTGALATMLCGLAPALRASGVAPIGVLSAASGRSTSRRGALRPLVGTQVGFSVVLLFLAGLLLVSFGKLTSVDLGFRASRLLLLTLESDEIRSNESHLVWAVSGPEEQTRTVGRSAEHEELLSLAREVQPAVAQMRAIGTQLLERVRRVPGVQSASLSGWPLFSEGVWRARVRLPGRAPDDVWSIYLLVSDGFFETMGIRLLDGRTFEPRDADPKTPTTVVVNEAFVRHYFGRERAVGRVFDRVLPIATVRQEIVGVVADAKYNDVREPAPPTAYVPLRGFQSLQVRAAGEPPALVDRLRRAIEAVHPSLRVTDVQRQSTLVSNTLLRERLLALLSAFFGVVGLLLAAVGLHGVLSYSVVQRTREIGIRLALGAQQLTVVRSVVADAGLTTLIGAAAGLVGGLYLARFVQTFLYEVEPLDFWSLAVPITCLLVAGALAAVRPARRAARVDPVVALRYE